MRWSLSLSTLGLVSWSDKEQLRRKAGKRTRSLQQIAGGQPSALERQGVERARRDRELGLARPAGWYLDPQRPGQHTARYWDGQSWTDETQH